MIRKELNMKKIIFGVAAAALLITGTIFVFAQKSRNHEHKGFGPGGYGHAAMFLRGLDLSVEQKAKVKDILDSSKTTVEPLMEQMRANHETLRSLGIADRFDQAQVEAIAAAQSNVMAQLIVEREKTKAQIFAILTDEQKAKAAEMHKNFDKKFRSRGPRPAHRTGEEF